LQLNPPLARGVLLRRYKRFLADVRLADGGIETMHCPNTGAMSGCDLPDSECWYSRSENPKRKYPCTLECVVTEAGRIGVNTGRANALVTEALVERRLPGFDHMRLIRAEVPIPDESGRFDLLLQADTDDEGGRSCYVEIKNVTLLGDDGLGLFPDAVSVRALKHVQALTRRVQAGDDAALVFCVQHTGIRRVSPAARIHPEYARAITAARAAGVAVRAYGCSLSPSEIVIERELPVV
jgi:sugar fermentation stimulation protein A